MGRRNQPDGEQERLTKLPLNNWNSESWCPNRYSLLLITVSFILVLHPPIFSFLVASKERADESWPRDRRSQAWKSVLCLEKLSWVWTGLLCVARQVFCGLVTFSPQFFSPHPCHAIRWLKIFHRCFLIWTHMLSYCLHCAMNCFSVVGIQHRLAGEAVISRSSDCGMTANSPPLSLTDMRMVPLHAAYNSATTFHTRRRYPVRFKKNLFHLPTWKTQESITKSSRGLQVRLNVCAIIVAIWSCIKDLIHPVVHCSCESDTLEAHISGLFSSVLRSRLFFLGQEPWGSINAFVRICQGKCRTESTQRIEVEVCW